VFWLVGVNLRTVVLGVPPTLPALHRALGLSYSAAGLLTSLPVLLMALGAIPGAFLISRVGARRAVGLGLMLVAIGAALRAAAPAAIVLYVFTVVLSLGIAVSQPAMPVLAQAWFPRHIARALAVYSNGLLIGEVIAATVTLPLLIAPFGWQLALAVWAAPVAVVLGCWLGTTPSDDGASTQLASWLPDWRSGTMLRIGLLMGTASLLYFGMNTWIPDTLDARGAHGLITPSLASLNAMQIPVSVLLTIFGPQLLGRRWPYVVAAIASLVGIGGYAFGASGAAPVWTGMVGAGSSLAFILNLGLPAMLSPAEVARTSGFMFTVGYGTAFFGPVLGGLLWDWSGHLQGHYLYALLPMALAAAAMLLLGFSLPALVSGSRARSVGSAAGS
jgi:CP family cyanate transporter-like MFS transporter